MMPNFNPSMHQQQMQQQSQSQQQQQTAGVFGWPGGRWWVGLAGLVVVGFAWTLT